MKEEMLIEGVRLTSPDKILFPEQGITKRELAEYYVAVADRMLPHVARRPITLVRCPAGREKNCFYQRHAGSGIPDELHEVKIAGFDEPYLYIKNVRGLIALVQMGTLEIHPWGVTVDDPTRPDRLIFDLDPDEALNFGAVTAAALEIRGRLDALDLESFVKTTGGKGLHVIVPVNPIYEWPRVKAFAKSFADEMAADSPNKYLTRISKAERAGRVFLDYLRNDPTSTAVGPYSTRSRAGAPVAMPISWDKVQAELNPASYNIQSVPQEIGESVDPWQLMPTLCQSLPG